MASRVITSIYLFVISLAAGYPAAFGLELVPSATLYDGGRRDVFFAGDTAFVASATGLEIFDVSEPSNPARIGQIIRTDGAVLIAGVPGGVALATRSDSLLIYSLADTNQPTLVRGFVTRGTATFLLYHRNYLYVADRIGWLRISFVAPNNPILDYVQTAPAPAGAFAFAGDSLFVARTDGKMLVYDVGGLPELIDVFPSRSNISSLVFGGSLAYAAAGDSGVLVYDFFRDPDNQEVGRFYTYGTAVELVMADSLLCVADLSRGLLVLGLADPERPFLLEANDQPDSLRAIDVFGSLIAGVGADGLFVFDISDPFRARIMGHAGDRFRVGDLAAEGNILIAAVERVGLSVMDIAEPAQPRSLAERHFVAKVYGVDLRGRLAGLACGDDGLLLVDLTQPTEPRELFRTRTFGFALDVALDDSLAVVADGGEGFRLFDITDPEHTRLIGGRHAGDPVFAVGRRENYVYVTGPDLGLEVYDISFAFKPTRVFHFVPEGRARDVFFADYRAFVPCDSGGIYVFDITNPASPILIDRLELILHPRKAVVSGGLVIALDDSAGVVLIDYRVRGAARVIATTPLSGRAVSAVYTGEALFVSGPPYLHALGIIPLEVVGDVDEDGLISLTDVVYLINYLLRGGPQPLRSGSADLNSDGHLNLVDLARLIHLIFF